MGHSFPSGMATGYSEVEIGHGEYIGYHHDSKMLFVPKNSNIGTAVNRNIKLVGIRNAEIVCFDAAEYDDLDKHNYIYLFNPFPSNVMVKIMQNIKKSLKRNPRVLIMIYLNPIDNEIINNSGVFNQFRNVEHSWMKRGTMIYYSQDRN